MQTFQINHLSPFDLYANTYQNYQIECKQSMLIKTKP